MTTTSAIYTYDELRTGRARRRALLILLARWEEDDIERTRYCRNGHPVRLGPAPRCSHCPAAQGGAGR